MRHRSRRKGDPEIEIWGDGLQTRAFMYVDDCVDGVIRLMESDYSEAVTLGPSRMISINDLVDLLGRLMDFDIVKKHVEGPQGVRGRNFNHTRVWSLGWIPQVTLEDGLERTSQWITQRVEQWFSGQP